MNQTEEFMSSSNVLVNRRRRVFFDNSSSTKEKQLKKKLITNKNAPQTISDCLCNLDCQRFTVKEIQRYFMAFYKMDYNEQSRFLVSLVELHVPKKRKRASRRKTTVSYYLVKEENGKKHRVCKKMICHTLQVTHRRLQILLEKLKNGIDINDQRGKHENHTTRMPEALKQSVMEHIVSFPSHESQFGRSPSMKSICLNPALTLMKMFRSYKLKYPDVALNYSTYRYIFHNEFNINFGFPRSDDCEICEKFYSDLISTEKQEDLDLIKHINENHHRQMDKAAYNELEHDKSIAKMSDSTVLICIDLQPIIFSDSVTHYNLAIYNMGPDTVHIYTWPENLTTGSDMEIASCLLKYITANFTLLQVGELKKLIIWSNGCHINSWAVVNLCQILLKLNFFTEFNQKFVTSAHSFLPCDCYFALIEKVNKITLFNTAEQTCEAIENARRINPFMVYQMESMDFEHINTILTSIKRNDMCRLNDARWLQIASDDPEYIRLRKSHKVTEAWKYYSLLPNAENDEAFSVSDDSDEDDDQDENADVDII